ncbi:putative serine racemase [Drechmeria coniospora]|uniref:Putative serine racemase n=1 Tax=Drechmeria coniospora TaxID=98403 RepID=A0A151GTL6_DRECN|nr:putative serine racemase [Drechmeria coniospora]KYK60420.1 putative serine racemase [Drechmeria coniospora]
MADLSTCRPLTRDSVMEAHKIVAPHVHRTPIMTSRTLSRMASQARTEDELQGTRFEGRVPARPRIRLWFKCENLQRVGAFKVRGAFHAVQRLTEEDDWLANGGRERGVVTHSSGNHAQALALAAKEHGIKAHIVMPAVSLPPKIAATRGYGAQIVFSGSTSSEREAAAAKVVAETGARLVPPYDHPDIMLGQGTMGIELQEQVEEAKSKVDDGDGGKGGDRPETKFGSASKGLDAIMTPCGGGGMLSGVALSCEGTGIRVFGAEPTYEGADDGKRGYYAGERVRYVSTMTVADGLRTPVGVHPWKVIYERRLVSGMYSVTEDEIMAAMRLLLERCKMVVEPSACVPLAVVLFDEEFRAMVEKEAGSDGWDLGLVLSGGNVNLEAMGAMFRAKSVNSQPMASLFGAMS